MNSSFFQVIYTSETCSLLLQMQGSKLLTLRSMVNNCVILFSFSLDLSEWHCSKSVLALVDGEVWDMYRPLTKSCEIRFLTFKDEDPEEVNKVSLYLSPLQVSLIMTA